MKNTVAFSALLAGFSGLVSSQSTTTVPCSCTTTIGGSQYTTTYTYTIKGSAACTSRGLKPTCPSSSPTSTSKSTSTITTKITTTSTTTKTTTVTTSTTSKTTSSGPCVPSPTKSTGKRGVSYNSTPLTKLFSLSCIKSKSSWSYNWYSSLATDNMASSYNSVLEYIPMLWSNATDLTSVWSTNAQKAINAGSSALLAFNEPDQCGNGGSCMAISDAVKAYKTYFQPFSGKARLGAPAVTNGDSPMGLTYFQNFASQCTGCTWDFVPIHWYGSSSSPDLFKAYVTKAYNTVKKPLWITEFAVTDGTEAQAEAFLKSVLPWLDSQSYVERYAYFMARPGFLVNDAGTALSAQGVIYETL